LNSSIDGNTVISKQRRVTDINSMALGWNTSVIGTASLLDSSLPGLEYVNETGLRLLPAVKSDIFAVS
jgi:hypothetical protein